MSPLFLRVFQVFLVLGATSAIQSRPEAAATSAAAASAQSDAPVASSAPSPKAAPSLEAPRSSQSLVIGALAMPEFKPLPSQPKRSYLAASYVKWLEGSGAQVVPLLYDAPQSETVELLQRLNGLLFPGGAFPMEPAYEHFSRFVFQWALKKGMPMWGECLGMLQFLLYTSGEASPGPVTDGWNATGPLVIPLHLTSKGMVKGPITELSEGLRMGITSKPWAWHSHAYTVGLSDFQSRRPLTDFWDVLAIDEDREGQKFVSMIAAKNAPVTATMFHPEKNSFEFHPERLATGAMPEVARSSAAIDAMAHFGHYFLNQCRSFASLVKMEPKDLVAWSIHNWAPKHTAPYDSVFESMYFFERRNALAEPRLVGVGQPLSRWGA